MREPFDGSATEVLVDTRMRTYTVVQPQQSLGVATDTCEAPLKTKCLPFRKLEKIDKLLLRVHLKSVVSTNNKENMYTRRWE